MSNFVETTCPSCGADISVPRKEKSVNCMYCSATVVVQEAIKQGAGGKKIKNMLQLAANASEAGNNQEAYNYYNQVLEIDMENPDAWVGKGIAAVWQSTIADDRSREMMPAFKSAFQNTSSREEKIELANRIAVEGTTAYLALIRHATNHWAEFGASISQYVNAYLPDSEAGAEYRGRLETHLSNLRDLIDFLQEQVNPVNEDGEPENPEDVFLSPEIYCGFLTASTFMYGSVRINNMGSSINAYDTMWYRDDIMISDASEDEESDEDDEGKSEGEGEGEDEDDIKMDFWKGKNKPIAWALNQLFVWRCLYELERMDLTEEQKESLDFDDPRKLGNIDTYNPTPSEGGGGGCFIATASLMDESHPDLLVLRSFRDNSLSASYLGKAFIDWYYRNGPTMAKHVKTSELLKALVKTIVVKPMVLVVKVFKIG